MTLYRVAFTSIEIWLLVIYRKRLLTPLLIAAYKLAQVFSFWGFVFTQVCQQRGGVSALGLEDVSTRDPEKGGELKPPAELSVSQLRTICQTNSCCTVGRVFVRVALWMRLKPPLTHTCPSPCPLYPLHSYLLTSVQLQPTLISTVSLQREPLKGQGWLLLQQSHQHEIYQNPRKEWKRQVQAGLLIIEWCRRWGT